ncbi:MAG TPA: PQQ-dependent sugar dehydrogenase [Nitrososphaera sp.]
MLLFVDIGILLLVSLAPAFALFEHKASVTTPELGVETFVEAISGPTTMAFAGNDILVLQKNDGKVRLVRDGVLQMEPVLDVNVANEGEQGLLGIAVSGSTVYLYFSESLHDGENAVSRRVYKYNWDGQQLQNQELVKDMKSTQTYHNGGGITTGPDSTVYLAVGDTGRYGILQNHGPNSTFYPDTSAIIPVAPEGPYYAIGVRNSFGIAFDPFTGAMWDTENGDDSYDEINMVKPYMNSGWEKVMGPSDTTALARLPQYLNYTYSEPEFSWEQPVAPTGLSFVRAEPLADFNDSLFVGDCNTGSLYRFVMNEQRDGFVFSSKELKDGVANMGEKADEIVFGTGFGCITDLETGPDGLLYITSYSRGAIFRLVPADHVASPPAQGQEFMILIYIIAGTAGTGAIVHLVMRRRKKTRYGL